ncbi:MAG: DUF4363 family protein [Caulobacteraceae bacterium]
MKPVAIIALVTAVIIAGGIVSLHMLSSESDSLYSNLISLEKDINNQNWSKSTKALDEFEKKWDKASKYWSMFIDHYEIDNIELELSQLESFIKTEEKSQALSRLSSLKTLIKHIPDKEAFTLKNIL